MHLGFFLYFAPTILAVCRRSRHAVAIFFLNLFLGWTVIGWIWALIWAARSEPRWVHRYAYGYYPTARRF